MTYLKFTFLISDDIIIRSQPIARWYFLFKVNSKDIGVSRLVKLLPSLLELKDNDAVVIGTIIT